MSAAAAPRFVLTGPSGWIGQAMLAHFARAWGDVLGETVTAFASKARAIDLPSGGSLAMRALDEIRPADVEGAHVVHLAYLTKEKAEELGERQFTETNLRIDDQLLNVLREARPRSVFVASSGAASLAATGVDLHPYGLGKLRQEARFLEWGARADVPVLAGRIFNLSGPYINKIASYAISNMAEQARETGAINIAATVPVFRSFLHVNDLCALVAQAAVTGVKRSSAVDLCGAEIVEMEDLASVVGEAVSPGVRIARERVDYGQRSVYLGDFTQTRILAMELGLPLASLRSQVKDTIDWLKSGGGCR